MPSDHDKFLADKGYGHLVAPESAVVPLASKSGWGPECEAFALAPGSRPLPRKSGCPACEGIDPGSMRYCLACGLSGFETRLDAQRQLMPAPARDPMPKADRLAGGVGKPKRGRPRKVA